MLYSIHGFSQRVAIELGLDDRDLAILRWFVQFKDSGKMSHRIINDDKYYWIDYKDGLCEDLPILGFKKDTFYRRLKKLCASNVLKHETIKKGGVYSYYALGDEYRKLIDDSIGNKSDRSDINSSQTDTNPKVTDINPNQTDLNPEQNTTILYSNTKLKDYTTTQSEKTLVVVNTNKEIIESKTHLKLESKSKRDRVLKWNKDRLIKAIEIFNLAHGRYFSFLEKIYRDDGNFITKKESPSSGLSTNNIIHKRNKFHNFDETFDKYSEDEFDRIVLLSQQKKFG